MKLPDYIKVLKKTYKDFIQNPILFIPIVIGFLLALLFIAIIGGEVFIVLTYFNISSENIIGTLFGSTTNILLLVLFTIVNFIIICCINAYTSAMAFGGFYTVALKQTPNFENLKSYALKLFYKIFIIRFITFFLFFLPLAFFAVIVTLLVFTNWIAAIIVGIFFLMIFITYSTYLSFGLFFVGPLLISKKLNAIDTIKLSFTYLHKNIAHVLLTWVIMVGIGMVIGIMVAMVTLPMQFMGGIAPFLVFIAIGIRIIINIIVAVYLQLFLFNSFIDYEKINKKK